MKNKRKEKSKRSVMIMKCCNLEHFLLFMSLSLSLTLCIQSCIHSNLLRIHFPMTSFKSKFQKPVSTHSIQMLIPITSSFTEQLINSCERIPNARQEKKKERKGKWRDIERTNERHAGTEEENCLELVGEKSADVDLNWAKDTISTS